MKVFLKCLASGLIVISAASAAQSAQSGEGSRANYRLNLNTDDYRLSRATDAQPTRALDRLRARPVAPQLAQKPYASLIHAAAARVAIDPALVHAVIHVESGYNQHAVSPAGAIGLMQLMPDTARRYGVHNPAHSPQANLRAGTLYLRDLLQQFDGRLDLVLAAYNAGEKAVVSYGMRIPPYAETRAYVPAVMAKFRESQTNKPLALRFDMQLGYTVYMPGTRLDSHRVDAEKVRR